MKNIDGKSFVFRILKERVKTREEIKTYGIRKVKKGNKCVIYMYIMVHIVY